VSDDAFNLTPLDIRKQEFRKTLRGYDTAGVEDFQVRVADALSGRCASARCSTSASPR